MKILLLIILLATQSAFATDTIQVENITASVRLMDDLRCEIKLGSDESAEERTNTILKSSFGDGLGIITGSHKNPIELKHEVAYAKGCDIAKLDIIVKATQQGFGFANNTPLEITKKTSESFINGFGDCVAIFGETIVFDLGQGITLVSNQGELRKMTNCK